MITLLFLFLVLISQVDPVTSDCPFIDLCLWNQTEDQVICNGYNGDQSEDVEFPSLACLPPVGDYFFSNYKRIQENAFENMTILTNGSIKLHLVNISAIDTNAFSASMVIPNDTTVSIYIDLPNDDSNINLARHAFNHISIKRLHFSNVNNFNGKSIFDTHCFSTTVDIDELIFKQSNITGFQSSNGLAHAQVRNLRIHDCPALKNLTKDSLPSFLETTKTLEISRTGLALIDDRAFQGWSLVLEELLIKNNIYLENFPIDMTSGFLMELKRLDLSNNSIVSVDPNYDWSPYYPIQDLILKHQEKLELFLQSNILKNLGRLRTIDFSEGIISENNEDLIRDYVPDMPNLISINISYTNFTNNMVIDLLRRVSNSANQTMQVSLLGHSLNGSDFCAYFQIFQQAPNLLRLELDETHVCNCVVDLFYGDENIQLILKDSLIEPTCVLNLTRARCDIQSQLILSKCSFGKQNSDNSNTNGDIGSYAFIGVMAGLTIVLIALLALGSSVVYRARRTRRKTILDMEDPVDHRFTASIQQPIEQPSESSF